MKQKDIAALILVVSITLVASWIFFNAVLKTAENRKVEVETVTTFDTTFPQPDPQTFNANSLNPTELIRISESDSDKPFNN